MGGCPFLSTVLHFSLFFSFLGGSLAVGPNGEPMVIPLEGQPQEIDTQKPQFKINYNKLRGIESGDEHIDAVHNEYGRFLRFYCKLCACEISDASAKSLHVNGKRHKNSLKVRNWRTLHRNVVGFHTLAFLLKKFNHFNFF